jgi:hypothetical protein
MVFVQNFDEIQNVGSDRFNVHSIGVANLCRDFPCLESFFQQVQDLCADDIQAEHPSVMNIEQNAAILGLRAPHRVRYLEHRLRTSEEFGLDRFRSGPLWHRCRSNSTNCALCSQDEGVASQANGTAEHNCP